MTFHTDIDECAESTAGCAQICHNDPGSFHCECHSGYQLGTDGKSCLGELILFSTITASI